NYLSNAIKFTPEGGRIALRVEAVGLDEFRLSVADTGVGVRAEDLGRLFVEFQQLDSATDTLHQGTGLGLALTKRIVEALGGKVGVESAPGRGSTFSATLPRVQPSRDLERSGKIPLLVLADGAEHRVALDRTLSRAGYAVVSAETLDDAIAAGREHKFDAIALDLMLPRTTSVELLREIRLSRVNRQTPVLVVSVVADGQDVSGVPVDGWVMEPLLDGDVLSELGRLGVSPRPAASVLVVDPRQAYLKRMKTVLADLGYRPLCVTSFEDALAAAATVKLAAVVIDPEAMGSDNLALLDQLRGLPRRQPTPIIAWTQDGLATDRSRRRRARG
ncbi:MAG TPA: ATP-binding protein, partial [Chloroflexota bacterium]